MTTDPITGNYQTLLPANSSYNVTIYADSSEHTWIVKTPDANQYREITRSLFVNAGKVTSTRVEIGNGISQNRDPRSEQRWLRTLKKKRTSRQVLDLADIKKPLASRFQADMDYLAEVLATAPEAKASIITHVSQREKNTAAQALIAQRIINYLKEKGVDVSNIDLVHAGSTKPRHENPRHHSNNRVELEIRFNVEAPDKK
jgi:outer membrane protein OmpA-like peptidoglycan-associated protein